METDTLENPSESFSDVPFGSILRSIRLSKNLSQGKMADLCGLTHRRISDMENNRTSDPKYSTLYRLAMGLKISPDHFFPSNLSEAEENYPCQDGDVIGGRPFFKIVDRRWGDASQGENPRAEYDILECGHSAKRHEWNRQKDRKSRACGKCGQICCGKLRTTNFCPECGRPVHRELN